MTLWVAIIALEPTCQIKSVIFFSQLTTSVPVRVLKIRN